MKAKCTSPQMMKVIRRNMSIRECDFKPEHNLIIAVIGGAVSDLLDKHQRRSAEYFFGCELYSIYCNMIGLNPETTIGLLVQGGFLTKDKGADDERSAVDEELHASNA